MKLEIKVEEIVNPIVKELGFEVEYVEFVKEGSNNILRIAIDNPGEKLWIEDCEKVSRAVEDIVDKEIEQEYILEVCSPGLERKLKNIRLYKKYLGKEIHIKLFKKLNDYKEFDCLLEKVNEENETIIVKIEAEEIEISLKDISSAYTLFDFETVLKNNTDNINLNKLNKFNKNN